MYTTPLTTDPSYAGVLPSTFAHGYSSASYQIEGGYQSGGRGPSIWDEHLKDSPDNGNKAVDSYGQWREDVALLKKYGANAYRFSVSWSRVKPLGGKNDPVNEEGIKYYSDLIDALLQAGITPYVTIYHWDLPLALEKAYGGWLTDDLERLQEDFLSYAELLFERYGDRVKHWITLNETWTMRMKTDFNIKTSPWKLGHHQTIVHAHIVDLYRKKFQTSQKGKIGISLDCDWAEPIDDSPEAKAAQEQYLAIWLGWFADPIYRGEQCALLKELVAETGHTLPDFTPEQLKLIKGSSDFFGLNHYGSRWVTGKTWPLSKAKNLIELVFGACVEETFVGKDGKLIGKRGNHGHPHMVPWGFRKLLRRVSKLYTAPNSIPIFITENGFAIEGECDLSLEEILNDELRQEYFAEYIRELVEAVRDDGIDMGGYFGWSLHDNLEWGHGYEPRFGVTHIDRANGFKRTPKQSTEFVKSIFEHVVTSKPEVNGAKENALVNGVEKLNVRD